MMTPSTTTSKGLDSSIPAVTPKPDPQLTTPPTPEPLPTRHSVRTRINAPILSAYALAHEGIFLVGGRKVRGFVGDWVVSQGSQIVDVVGAGSFAELYAPTESQGLILTDLDRATLALMLGHGSTDSSQTLTRAVLRLARLTIGDINVTFTVHQWEELVRRADKRGKKIGVYMQQMVEKLLQDLWSVVE